MSRKGPVVVKGKLDFVEDLIQDVKFIRDKYIEFYFTLDDRITLVFRCFQTRPPLFRSSK